MSGSIPASDSGSEQKPTGGDVRVPNWIKVCCDLPDKVEVMHMARALNVQVETVVGGLVWVWSWFNRHTTDGACRTLTLDDVNAMARIDDFAQAMREVGWLVHEEGGDTIRLTNFDRHSFQTEKQRLRAAEKKRLAAERSRKHRKKKQAEGRCKQQANGNASNDASRNASPNASRDASPPSASAPREETSSLPPSRASDAAKEAAAKEVAEMLSEVNK